MGLFSNRQESILRTAAITGDDDPQHPQGAWGEQDEDYNDQQKHQSWGKDRYDYDSKYMPEDIRIKDKE